MKTILKIIVILLVAGIVAGGFTLAVGNSSIAASTGTAPLITNAEGQTFQPMERPEGGDRDGGSLTGGLGGVLGTLAKLIGISILVLLLQKGFRQLGNLKLNVAGR